MPPLVLNGRRVAVSSFANGQESFIDVNSIPLAAVQQVDILTSGASATYGADAVAGVVNILLRDDFDGLELGLSYQDSTASSDEGRYSANLVWGDVGEYGNTMVVLDYYKRNPFFDRDRDFSANSVRPSQQGIYPSFNDLFFNDYVAGDEFNGIAQSAGGDATESPAIGGCPAEQFGAGRLGQYCELNANAYASIDSELESFGGLATFNFDISEDLTWFNELMFQTYESNAFASPATFDQAAVSTEHPDWTPEFQAELVARGLAEGGAADFDDYRGFPIYAWGRFTDPRAVERNSQSLRIVSGFEGIVGTWDWSAALSYGQNDSEQRGISGLYKSDLFAAALVGTLCTDGAQVEEGIACEDDGRETLWYNPFGGQAVQAPEVDSIIKTTAERSGKSTMIAADVVASGPVMELPAGALQVAVGAETRREDVVDTPAADAVATPENDNPILGFSSTSADYERSQSAVFAEAYIPIINALSVQVAGRYDYYDDFGGDFNPKIGFRYQPFEQLTIRGNTSTSFRAPSLAQSGSGTLLSSYSVDCGATPEACNNDAIAEGESLLSEDLGNPELQPEEAVTSGIGFKLSPTNNFDITMDYWSIDYENIIGIDEDDFIRRAFAGEFSVVGEDELATGTPGLEVDAGGFVTDAHFPLVNLGEQQTSGVDVALTKYFDATRIGNIALFFDATYTDRFVRKSSDVSERESLVGEFRFPRWKAQAKARWSINDWSASISAHYTHNYKDDPANNTLEALGLPVDTEVRVSSWLVWDTSISYDLAEGSFIQLKINNIFDRDPPRVLGSGANVDHFNHDSYGTTVKLKYVHRF